MTTSQLLFWMAIVAWIFMMLAFRDIFLGAALIAMWLLGMITGVVYVMLDSKKVQK